MKFSLAIFVALLCAATVSGAPSTPNLSFQELALMESADWSGIVDDWADKIKCITHVLDDELVGNLTELLEQYRAELEKLAAEWNKCSSAGSVVEQLTCKASTLVKLSNVLTKLHEQLSKVIDPEHLKELRKKVVDKCLKTSNSLFDEVEEFVGSSLPDQFQCIVDTLGDVSNNNGLADLWSKSQPQLQLHLDSWKRCANIENKVANLLCQIKEGATTYRLINEYFRLVAAQKPTVLIQIVSQVQKNCNGQQSLEEYMEIAAESDEFDQLEQYGLISSAIEKLNCIITAITEALLYTEFEKPWAKLVEDIQKYIENIRNCKQKPNYLEEAKCVVSESSKAYRIVFNFLNSVRNLNRELYNNVKTQIKDKCFK